jgi:hypothetical protein
MPLGDRKIVEIVVRVSPSNAAPRSGLRLRHKTAAARMLGAAFWFPAAQGDRARMMFGRQLGRDYRSGDLMQSEQRPHRTLSSAATGPKPGATTAQHWEVNSGHFSAGSCRMLRK